MRLNYEADEAKVSIRELPGGTPQEIELELQFAGEHPDTSAMKRIQHDFESNRVITDASFYAYHHHRYRIIVRQDYYEDLILELLRHRLIRKAEWV
ncbi:hypothetical protein [Gorillibacterium sp. sgz5001074]|uniref:hypothetical protein n=1 Tax=Gorillibacterium sp. sgz5001074 TaxID=3446695 RepID=UPI003F674C73